MSAHSAIISNGIKEGTKEYKEVLKDMQDLRGTIYKIYSQGATRQRMLKAGRILHKLRELRFDIAYCDNLQLLEFFRALEYNDLVCCSYSYLSWDTITKMFKKLKINGCCEPKEYNYCKNDLSNIIEVLTKFKSEMRE